jgi:TonB family protein
MRIKNLDKTFRSLARFRLPGGFAIRACAPLWLCGFILFTFFPGLGQRIAVITPEHLVRDPIVRDKIEESLAGQYKITDADLSDTVFKSAALKKPFNLSTEESRNLGMAAGVDFFILTKSETLRRASVSGPDYFESYAAIFCVSSRTGRLVLWKLLSNEDKTGGGAEAKSARSLEDAAREVSSTIKSALASEMNEPPIPVLGQIPETDENGFRPPLPYRRIKPAYTTAADMYGVEATVDVAVDLNSEGRITRTEIIRWAGFGLDESVEKTVRAMQWRPAERDGKTLPLRVLLRYNFKKIERKK